MGRTKRIRRRRSKVESLEHESFLIALKRFMIDAGFENNSNLQLKNFPQTGRGVGCTKCVKEQDILIKIPLKVMITHNTLAEDEDFMGIFATKLKIHDLLAAFLVYERHKNETSCWKYYMDSLPMEPPWLPCFMSECHMDALPVDLRLPIKQSRRLLEESWSRLRQSIKPGWTCNCCRNKANRVFQFHTFSWAYSMVNTRAVYIDPKLIRGQFKQPQLLSEDDPSMALCPYLDMFNHDFNAKTVAEIAFQQGQHFYQLKTLTNYEKHQQVFISYGAHDNVKLLIEYGFFIPGNFHDILPFQWDQVYEILQLKFSKFQYEFVQKHNLTEDLFLSNQTVSFRLKGLLYLNFAKDLKDWTSAIYNQEYSQEFSRELKKFCTILLTVKQEETEEILERMKMWNDDSMIVDCIGYRSKWLAELINKQQFIDF